MSDGYGGMLTSLEAKTGKTLAWWTELVKGSGLAKHAQIVSMLKNDHGLTYGYANFIALIVLESSSLGADPDGLVEGQYAGKENLRPIYDGVLKVVNGFGQDVEVAPKKAGVSLRRKKQFALVEPTTKTRVDIGINLKGDAGTDRLKVAGGMCTHKVAVTDASQVDDELIGWLRRAYELA